MTVSKAGWGSDVVVDMLQALGIEYIALNPGASYRGIHDSLVNYAGAKPEIVLCNHEGIAVAVAHGYANASGRPMAAAVHDVVGLLNASERIYNAWLDTVPVLVIGGTGPVASDQRRPHGDWIHTALVQSEAVREFTKFDDQPSSVKGMIDSMLRAYQVATTGPEGPVYLCFDAGLQEAPLPAPVDIPDVSMFPPIERPQASAETVRGIADLMLAADRPVVIANRLGDQAAVDALVEVAEVIGASVIEQGDLYNFPSRHPLNLTDAAGDIVQNADVILALNIVDPQSAFARSDFATRSPSPVVRPESKIIDVTLRHYGIKSWAQSYGGMFPMEMVVSADVRELLPRLASAVSEAADDATRATAVERIAAAKAKRQELSERFNKLVADPGNKVTLPFVAQQVWELVQAYDWTLVDRDLRGNWAHRLWNFTKVTQFTGTTKAGIGGGLGRAIGAALANRGTGRLNIHFQPDGDMLFTPSALWTLANQELPVLIVTNNNRSYGNDERHQEEVAFTRERPPENKGVGIRIEGPDVDFAAMARSYGVHGEGPITQPADLRPALERALRVVLSGKPALVDAVVLSGR
jgi:thiamine pyrophosphate-dependent acetolactate synthase large subunit-like protein